MAASDLVMNIIAKDSASGVLNRVGSAAGRLDKSQRGLTKTSRATSGAFTTMRRAAIGLATSYAAIKVVEFAKDSIDAASALQEAGNANIVMFKKQSSEVAAWAKTASTSFGMSERAALVGAKRFATFGTAAGLSGKRLTNFSTDLTELATDLASFHDTTVEEAMTALSSGLGGEMEAMRRRYGVMLDIATLKSRAVKMGLIEEGDALSQQNKILAANAEIWRQTREEQGDFTRTSGDWANQTRQLTAHFEELRAAVGGPLMGALTPYLRTLTQAMPQITDSIRQHAPAAQQAIAGFAKTLETSIRGSLPQAMSTIRDMWPELKQAFSSFASTAGTVGQVLKKVADVFLSLPPGVQETVLKVAGLAVAFAKLKGILGGLGLLKAVSGFGRLGASAATAAIGVGTLSSTIDKGMTTSLAGAGAAGAGASKGVTKLGTSAKTTATSASRMEGALAGLGGAMTGVSSVAAGAGTVLVGTALSYRWLKNSMLDASEEAGTVATALQQNNNVMDQSVAKVMQTEVEASGLATTLQDIGVSQDTFTQAVMGNEQALDQMNAALVEAQSGVGSVDDAFLSFLPGYSSAAEEAQLKLQSFLEVLNGATAAGERNGYATDGQRDAMSRYQAAIAGAQQQVALASTRQGAFNTVTREGRAAIHELGAATGRAQQEFANAGHSQQQVAASARQARAEFIQTATAIGLSEGRAKQLARQYGLIPKRVKTNVTADGADKAGKDAQKLKSNLNAIPKSKRTKITADGAEEAGNKTKQLKTLFGLLPKSKSTKVSAPGADESRNKIDDAKAAADKYGKTKSTAKINESGAAKSQGSIDSAQSSADQFGGTHATASLSVTGLGQVQGTVNAARAALNSFAGMHASGTVSARRVATGGFIQGPGTATSDSILARLSNGEFVQRAAAVSKYGVGFMTALNRGLVDPKSLPAYKKGGKVRGSGFSADELAWIGGGNPYPMMRPDILGVKPPKSRTTFRKEAGVKGLKGDKKQKAIQRADKKYDQWKSRWDNKQRLKDARRQWKDDAKREADQKRQDAKDEAERKKQEFLDALQQIKDEQDRKKQEAADEAARKAEEARQEAERIADAKASAVDQMRGGMLSNAAGVSRFASASGFDLSAGAQAQEQYKAAMASIAAARTPEERAKAVAAAREAGIAAQNAAATPANVTRWMQDKLKTLTQFNGVLGKLKKKGLHPVTLAEVASMAPDDGVQLGNALLGANMSQINSLQSQIMQQSMAYGFDQYGRTTNADLLSSNLIDNMIRSRTRGGTQQVSVGLYLDGYQIDQSLVRLNQRRGQF